MRRSLPLTLGLMLAAATPLLAGTFDKSRIAPDLGLDVGERVVDVHRAERDRRVGVREQIAPHLIAGDAASQSVHT